MVAVVDEEAADAVVGVDAMETETETEKDNRIMTVTCYRNLIDFKAKPSHDGGRHRKQRQVQCQSNDFPVVFCARQIITEEYFESTLTMRKVRHLHTTCTG